MRKVKWTDANGYHRVSMIRDTDSDELAPMGIPCEPPDINQVDWSEVKRDLHNLLIDRGIITKDDISRSQGGLRSAIEGALYHRLIALYLDNTNK